MAGKRTRNQSSWATLGGPATFDCGPGRGGLSGALYTPDNLLRSGHRVPGGSFQLPGWGSQNSPPPLDLTDTDEEGEEEEGASVSKEGSEPAQSSASIPVSKPTTTEVSTSLNALPL